MNHASVLYIILLLAISVIFIASLNTYLEPFDPSIQSVVLLGDSILKNNAYVDGNNSIETILREKTNGKSHCYAKDDAKITDIFQQIDKIPLELDSLNTTIFLSAGGNDILSFYVERLNESTDSQFLRDIFISYKSLVKSIQTRMSKSKIVLLDVYYPRDEVFQKYRPVIENWNSMIYSLSGKTIGLLKISELLTVPEDFKMGIEPSGQGGTKIIGGMMRIIQPYNT